MSIFRVATRGLQDKKFPGHQYASRPPPRLDPPGQACGRSPAWTHRTRMPLPGGVSA
jgi:hypothetical protein